MEIVRRIAADQSIREIIWEYTATRVFESILKKSSNIKFR